MNLNNLSKFILSFLAEVN